MEIKRQFSPNRNLRIFAKMEKGILFQPYGVHFRLLVYLSAICYFDSKLFV
jgi:hypothetical protein